MNRIFFRIFPLAILAFAVATVAIYFVISHVFGDPFEELARKQASGPIFLLEQYIDNAPADEWLVRLNKVREVSSLSLELVPLETAMAGLQGDKREALKRGEIVLNVSAKTFFRRVDLYGDKYIGSADDVLRVSNLPIDIGLEVEMEALRFVVAALFLLVPIALWSRFHWKELQSLSQVAEAFGEGNLSVRAVAKETASVYPLAQCMNHMAERIEGLLDAQRNLLHSVSHELRTPISRIEFGLELLRKAAKSDELGGRIGSLEADVRELNALVSELLSLTRLDQRQAAQPGRFALEDLLHHVADGLAHAFAGKEATLQVPADLGEIVADQRLLARAVGNLLANAAKYANSRLSLSAARLGDRIEITVDDDGPGIPADEREHVFEPFYRLDRSRDRATGGFGLGLAIARKAMQLHDGTIEIADSPLGGARFVLRMPCRQ
ncbi:MAG TPA: ATP-binding protein [Paucimonas sp.]|nr:ATP-binding protein [Paucimonas sp.]